MRNGHWATFAYFCKKYASWIMTFNKCKFTWVWSHCGHYDFYLHRQHWNIYFWLWHQAIANVDKHTHNRFMALWILSGTTRVSQYQKKHSLTQHLSWSSVIPYLLLPFYMIHGILPVQSTCLTVFFHNLSPSLLKWSASWPGTLHFILHIFFAQSLSFFTTA